MIWELWQTLTTPVSVDVRRMGYLAEAVAMAARAERCHEQWDEHYQFCQISIQNAMNECSCFHTALIFGAGSLQDVPLQALSQRFERVVLVDLVFLKSAKKRVEAFSNIELVVADVSESLDAIVKGQTKLTSPQRWLNEPNIDLVVSLNMITQLLLLPAKWLLKHAQVSEPEIERFSQQMIRDHLQYLHGFCGVVCLIADRWNTEFNRFHEVVDQYDPWWEVEPPKIDFLWDWNVVPKGEGVGKNSQINRVGVSVFKVQATPPRDTSILMTSALSSNRS